jgi:uncharacterized membrane protein
MLTSLPIVLIMRWVHILSAIIALGGTIFMRYVLHPVASDQMNDVQHEHFRAAIRKRWQRIVHLCIVLFLVSGLYNFVVVMVPLHRGDGVYHALFGIKFLLAMVLFLVALFVTSSKNYAAKFRANAPFWMGIIIALGIVIVLISGVMKNRPASTTSSSDEIAVVIPTPK